MQISHRLNFFGLELYYELLIILYHRKQCSQISNHRKQCSSQISNHQYNMPLTVSFMAFVLSLSRLISLLSENKLSCYSEDNTGLTAMFVT